MMLQAGKPTAVLQQAPVGGGGTGQLTGSHGMPAPSQVYGARHSTWFEMKQAGNPTARLQQAPVGGGGTGQVWTLHAEPSPR